MTRGLKLVYRKLEKNMNFMQQRAQLLARLRAAERVAGRSANSVQLLAVSKTQPASSVRILAEAGQSSFGENYLQETQEKLLLLSDLNLEWHFIGPLQSNKTRSVASIFSWVHSVDRWKVAQRLSDQRPAELLPLNICLEVNVSGEKSKSGVTPADLMELAKAVVSLPRLRLRGLMTIPNPLPEGISELEARAPFRILREHFETLRRQGIDLDTLSMGMSDDLEAAIAEGATMVRVGTALFGKRSEVKV
ncbi:PLP homeostasis protein [Gammaproteobacteria bacterium]